MVYSCSILLPPPPFLESGFLIGFVRSFLNCARTRVNENDAKDNASSNARTLLSYGLSVFFLSKEKEKRAYQTNRGGMIAGKSISEGRS